MINLLKKSRFWVHHRTSLWRGISTDASVVFFVYPWFGLVLLAPRVLWLSMQFHRS
jgi:hypothetical protein